jgi:hypothetical protein
MKKRRSRRLQQRIDSARARTESLGSGIFIDDGVPDDILDAFLDEIEGCPLCRELEQARESRPEPSPSH